MRSLPVFLRLSGRAVILLGEGDAAAAKRRLLEQAGARIVGEAATAALAIVAIDDAAAAGAAIARLKARGILVNAVDRPEDCDFTLPAIVARDPVLIAIGTGGVSAGLAAAMRQHLEAWLPATLGTLATRLHELRAAMRQRWPDAGERRRALAAALAAGGALDPLGGGMADVAGWLDGAGPAAVAALVAIRLRSADPDDLTLREARLLARADRIHHAAAVPPAVLARARADAARTTAPPPRDPPIGLAIDLDFA